MPIPLGTLTPSPPKPIVSSQDTPKHPGSPSRLGKYLDVAPHLLDRFNDHVRRWGSRRLLFPGKGYGEVGCTSCDLCRNRRNVVLFRGCLPCDILFIGEAPGESEDAIGVPFVGPAGRQLDGMIFQAYSRTKLQQEMTVEHRCGIVGNARGHLSYGITNILGCIPRTQAELSSGEIRKPMKQEAAACEPRVAEILALASPQRIVLLGDIAKRFFPKVIKSKNPPTLPRWDGEAVELTHPSRILHLQEEDPRAAVLLEKKFILGLTSVMEGLQDAVS